MKEGYIELGIIHLHCGSNLYKEFIGFRKGEKLPCRAKFNGLPVVVIGEDQIFDDESENGAVNVRIAGSSPSALNELDMYPR